MGIYVYMPDVLMTHTISAARPGTIFPIASLNTTPVRFPATLSAVALSCSFGQNTLIVSPMASPPSVGSKGGVEPRKKP